MTTPCEQATTIAKIEVTLDHVVDLLERYETRIERHEDREERMLQAMETVAAQTEQIHANIDNINRHEKAINELFTLIREHVTQQEKTNWTLQILKSPAGIYILGAIVIGTVIDFLAHFKILSAIWDFIRG